MTTVSNESKEKNHKILGIIRIDKHRCFSQCLLDLVEGLFGFNSPFYFIPLPEHDCDMLHQFNKI
jgi:hypothetical protein